VAIQLTSGFPGTILPRPSQYGPSPIHLLPTRGDTGVIAKRLGPSCRHSEGVPSAKRIAKLYNNDNRGI
jgi:hypothetical protein